MGNGDVLVLMVDSVCFVGYFNVNDVYVDGNGVGDIGNVVLWDCCILFEEGLVLVVVMVDIKNKEIMVGLDIFFCGFVYMCEFGDMIYEG